MRPHLHTVAPFHQTPTDPIHSCLLGLADDLTDCLSPDPTPESIAEAREIAERMLADFALLDTFFEKPGNSIA